MTDRHQNHQDPITEEVERNERWLRDHLADLPAPNLDTIKEHVRIAIHERWLEETMRDDCPAALAHGIKAATRSALCEESHSARGGAASGRLATGASGRLATGASVGRRSWTVFAGWGLAAAACFALYVGLSQTNRDNRVAQSDASQYDPFLTSAEDDEILLSLTALGAGIGEAEASLDEYASVDTVDALLDDLTLELDGVLTDDDWSS